MDAVNQTDVRLDDAPAVRPERDALIGSAGRPERRRGPRERILAPEPDFRSYYGLPVLNPPTWKDADIAAYLFLGGLAGASSALAAAADLTGRPHLARACKAGAMGALGGSLYGLVHDLGRPERFLNMLRVFKITSPMSVGSWLLSVYGPQAAAAAATALTGRLPRTGRAATIGAGLLGTAVATYTAVLIADTAVPVWHDGHRELPYLFAGSATASAAGLGLLAAPPAETGPARRAAVAGLALEFTALKRMERRLGPIAEPLRHGTGGRLLRLGTALSLTGVAAAALAGPRDRATTAAAGVALLAGAVCTRFGVFHAGLASARDPKYTVGPQRRRLTEATEEEATP